MFVTPLDERVYKPDEWVLLAPLIWRTDAYEIAVPRGFITDHASVPKPLRGLIDVNGTSRKPAVLHDWLYCSQLYGSRDFADALLRTAMAAEGAGIIERNIFYAGVRMGGGIYWNKRKGDSLKNDFVPADFWFVSDFKTGNKK